MLIRSLSARLLVLTIFFVMLSEVLIFVPSVARFRMTWLDNHIASGHLAALILWDPLRSRQLLCRSHPLRRRNLPLATALLAPVYPSSPHCLSFPLPCPFSPSNL